MDLFEQKCPNKSIKSFPFRSRVSIKLNKKKNRAPSYIIYITLFNCGLAWLQLAESLASFAIAFCVVQTPFFQSVAQQKYVGQMVFRLCRIAVQFHTQEKSYFQNAIKLH